MTYSLEPNEISSTELLELLSRLYGTQLNGSPFSSWCVHNWIRIKSVPQAYGGYKIKDATRYKSLGNLLVLTLDGFSREEMESIVGSLDGYEQTHNGLRKIKEQRRKPHKHRTKLYYQILGKSGKQWTKKTLNECTLPQYYVEAGIKQNQLSQRKRSKTPVAKV